MRYKILIGVLILTITSLSAFTYHYYSTVQSQQATMNNMRGQAIVAWARQMTMAAYYLNNASTNIDIYAVNALLRSISDTALTAWISDGDLYHRMSLAADITAEHLGAYAEGAPTFVKHINPIAINKIKELAQKIENTTRLVMGSTGPWFDLLHLEGADPLKLLQERDILDSIINGCIDIQALSQQISNIEPRFQ